MKAKLTTMLAAARERQGAHYLCGFIHSYCDNSKCTAREITVKIKTYGAADPISIYCPLCGQPPKLNGVQTLTEHEERVDHDARIRVNIQRYQKRTGSLFINAAQLFDDSLPE
jgi:hypothetical protein